MEKDSVDEINRVMDYMRKRKRVVEENIERLENVIVKKRKEVEKLEEKIELSKVNFYFARYGYDSCRIIIDGWKTRLKMFNIENGKKYVISGDGHVETYRVGEEHVKLVEPDQITKECLDALKIEFYTICA